MHRAGAAGFVLECLCIRGELRVVEIERVDGCAHGGPFPGLAALPDGVVAAMILRIAPGALNEGLQGQEERA
ncbi:hypothetical protein Rmf_25820 [Roseomonas fluvialis]|uniref:Uncharacterized protein n=1 Tax=Roseomonas fluvialis TaxID=1750527 RepID=A0ABN6P438_9PROT|nr:hypothetical protein Rmf_25820 [Roseomonas fluvialis]